MKFIFLFLVTFNLGTRWALALDAACIKNTVVRGNNCNNLLVNFDFSNCGESAPQTKSVRSSCVNQKAVAFVKTPDTIYIATYAAPLNEDGAWRFLTLRSQAREKLSSPAVEAPVKASGTISSENVEVKMQEPAPAPVPVAMPGAKVESVSKEKDCGCDHDGGCDMDEHEEGLKHHGFVDLYYMYSGNNPQLIAPGSPTSGTLSSLPASNVQYRSFDNYAGSMSLALAELTLQKEFGHAGGQIDLGFGNTAALMSPNDIAGQNVLQAKLYYKGDRWKFSVGKMYTHVTLEEPYATENYNYSRSMTFTYIEPLWHMGAALEYEFFPQTFSATLYAYNAWSGAYQTNQPYGGIRLRWTPTETWTINYNGIYEVAANNTNGGTRQEHEMNFTWTPMKGDAISAEYLWGYQTVAFANQDAQWSACQLMDKYTWDKFSLAARLEYIFDPQGYAISGQMGAIVPQSYVTQNLMNGTITGDYEVQEGAHTILEVRQDSSDVNSFTQNGIPMKTNGQLTGTIAFLYEF